MPRGQLRSLVVYAHAVDRTDNGAPENPKLTCFVHFLIETKAYYV